MKITKKSMKNWGVILEKDSPIIDDLNTVSSEQSSWMEDYTKMHEITQNQMTNMMGIPPEELGTDEPNVSPEENRLPSLLPIAMKVAARTISQELVSVQPLGALGIPSDKVGEIEKRLEQENREGKIDSVIDNKNFKEKTLEDDKEYKRLVKKYGTSRIDLMYLDYIYGDDKTDDDN